MSPISIASVLTIHDMVEVVDFTTATESWGIRDFEKFIAPPSSQTVKEADLGRVLSINHQFLN